MNDEEFLRRAIEVCRQGIAAGQSPFGAVIVREGRVIAAAHNNPPMIGLLMESGTDPEAKNNQGQTASDVAQLNGNLEAAQAIKVLATAKAASAAPAPAGEPKSTSQ